MAFHRYQNSCSPYDVQAHQGGRFDFAKVAKRYEDIIPLRGKRKAENIRPINRRDRAWERIVKVSDTEYYVTFDAWRYGGSHNKAITWSLNNGLEFMTIHTPKKVWGATPSMELYPSTFSSSSTFWFYDFNLPPDFGMVNYRANKYVRYDNKYYSVELGDITFQRKVGENHWLPLVVHREFKHTIDRKQTKQLRESIKPFMDYYDIMCDIVDKGKWEYGNPIYRAIVGNEDRTVYADEAITLFKPSGDDVPDAWLGMVERYKQKITGYDYQNRSNTHLRHKLPSEICKDLFRIVKPCKITEVPLGTLTHDRYKQWYR
jgi:hypothetical protein